MALPAQILEDSTDTLTDYLDHEGTFGNVASVEVRVMTASSSPGAFEEATLETTSYTLAAAARGAQQVAWTAAAGTAPVGGNRYAIGKAAGATPFPIVVEVERVDTDGQVLYLRSPLPAAIVAGDVLKGLQVSHALTAAETSASGRASAIWQATLTTPYKGRSVLVWEQYFRVVPQFFVHGLTQEEAVRTCPEIRRYIAGGPISLAEAIDAAWEARLLPDLEGQGIDIWSIKSSSSLRPALAFATLYHLVAFDEALNELTLERFRAQYSDRLNVTLASKEVWIDTGDTGALPGDEESPATEFHGELLR